MSLMLLVSCGEGCLCGSDEPEAEEIIKKEIPVKKDKYNKNKKSKFNTSKTSDYQTNSDGHLQITDDITIEPFKVSDGNVKYTIFFEGERTNVYTYHTAHKSINEMVDFIMQLYDREWKGNNKAFEY